MYKTKAQILPKLPRLLFTIIITEAHKYYLNQGF